MNAELELGMVTYVQNAWMKCDEHLGHVLVYVASFLGGGSDGWFNSPLKLVMAT